MLKNDYFFRFAIPIIDSLKILGGSCTDNELYESIIKNENISENELNVFLKSGVSRIKNQIAWSKIYLEKASLIDSSKRGVITLTEIGNIQNLEEKNIYEKLNEIKKKIQHAKKNKSEKINEKNCEENIEILENVSLLEMLNTLSPAGFEKICQRLLREAGFENVEVIGKSGDGGIDGIGILEINPFVRFKVIFQCKRYKGSVSSSQVRDFRGAMSGRADKGIIVTTGTFTLEAKKEANRDGVTPIELVDGEKLIIMFQKLELGLKPKTIYEIDLKFFDEYK